MAPSVGPHALIPHGPFVVVRLLPLVLTSRNTVCGAPHDGFEVGGLTHRR
jgi:hypothetical protein